MATNAKTEPSAPEDVLHDGRTVFQPAPELNRPAPLDATAASLLDTHLRAIDTVRIRVLGNDLSPSASVQDYLLAKGISVEVSLAEQMIPPPRSRYVFRYEGRTAFLTIAPDID
ncbi:hypothetical protein [Falsirhodobacter sp. alg1]|uniref:hypothetical protein n=1 Tax=Falsirhodobacter sp. alg1 TaxID=1472418 RepID=UPI0005F07EB0|nr:hypothetical protein [Falsirhodobacter sp. alg1]